MYERSAPLMIVNAAPEGPGRGVAMFGAPRGGTSMAAGVLRLIGVDMGERQGNGNNEDLDIQDARGPVDVLADPGRPEFAAMLERLRPVLTARAGVHTPWGWKDPHGVFYVEAVADLLPAPRLIAVFRDPAATAERIGLLTGTDRLQALEEVLNVYARARAVLARTSLPAAILSYEKALVRPDLAVAQLADFCGVTPDPGAIAEAVAFIYPERGHGNPELPGWPRGGAL